MATSKGKASVSVQAGGTTSLDVEGLRQLVEILETSEITRLDWVKGDERLSIRRGPPPVAAVPHVAPSSAIGVRVTAEPSSVEARPRPSAPARPTASPTVERKGHVITSPFVGTFYRSPGPDQPVFVEVGSAVKKGQALCIIEAMKLMNEIESEVQGKVAEVLVQNGQPVEFGQPLFRIEP
jgi:acetyl-CoA carboxylase biotin carboxyl carrier protein